MAATLRVLLHDKNKNISIVTQLKEKNSRSFYDAALPIHPNLSELEDGRMYIDSGYHGLVFIVSEEGKPDGFRAVLDDGTQSRWLPFNDWWYAPAIIDHTNRILTRKDIVLHVAETDGGAHLDPELEEIYYDLTRNNSIGATSFIGNYEYSYPEPERFTLRHIAHEVIKSFIPEYRKKIYFTAIISFILHVI